MSNAGQIALTVVGGVAGFIMGGPAGAYYGAQAGAMAGSLLFPTELPGVQGPRLDDLSVQTSTYGAAIPLVYGPQNRVSGNVIWSTGLIETVKKTKAGGKGGGSQEQTTYSYRASFAVALSGRPGKRIARVWANTKLLYDASSASDFVSTPLGGSPDAYSIAPAVARGSAFASIRFYPGDRLQLPDDVIESTLGIGEAPAYRGTCYIVLADLQLADYGNSLPNIEVELVADEAITAGAVVRDICRRGGVEAVATFLDDPVRGYRVANQMQCTDALVPLALAYDFDMVEQYGQVRAVRRASNISVSIPEEELACVDAGATDPVDAVTYTRRASTDLPRVANVAYPDPDFDFQPVTQQAARSEVDSEQEVKVELPVVVSAQEARRIAAKVLWSRWAEARTAKFSICDRYARLMVGQIVGVPVAGVVQPLRITNMTRGDNGVIEIEAAYEDALAYDDQTAAAFVTAPENVLRIQGDTELVLLDAPLLRGQDDDPGFYWAATSRERVWRGASVQRSVDGGVNYNEMSPVAVRASIGDVAMALPAGPAAVWDEGNTLTVVLRYPQDSLSSGADLDVLGGANAAWLGPADGDADLGEVIQWRTATLLAPATYQLSGLLRGRMGTEHAIATHGAGEVLVVLDSAIGSSQYGITDWDRLRQFRPVTYTQRPEDVAAQDFTNTGERQRPRSPVHIVGERDGGNNLALSWVRRTRVPWMALTGPAPLGETSERYEVDVIVGGNPVRTLTATAPAVAYSAAEQTADGITLGAPVTIRVFQLSETRGRGRPGLATV